MSACFDLHDRFVRESVSLLWLQADENGRIVELNPGGQKILGLTRHDAVGHPLAEVLTSPDWATVRSLIGRREEPDDRPLILNFVTSHDRPLSLNTWFGFDSDRLVLIGEPPDDPLVSVDEFLRINNELATISREHARTSRRLASALEELRNNQAIMVHQEKMASLGRMTAGIAHEINNPLSYVLGHVATLATDVGEMIDYLQAVDAGIRAHLHDQAEPALSRLRDKADEIEISYLMRSVPRKLTACSEGLQRVRAIVDDLRRFVRLDEGSVKRCDPVGDLPAALRFLKPLLCEHQVTLETDLEAGGEFLCQPAALSQAVSNLVANAIQASAPGSTVTVRAFTEGQSLVIEVSDRGCGMTDEVRSKVFEPFFTTKDVGQGSGLGLAIALQVARAHNGSIHIDSTPMNGTTARLIVPKTDNLEGRERPSQHRVQGETHDAC